MYPPPFDPPVVPERYDVWEERDMISDIKEYSKRHQVPLGSPKGLQSPPPIYDPCATQAVGEERHRAPQSVESHGPPTIWSHTAEQTPTLIVGDWRPAYYRIFWWILWIIFLLSAAAAFAIGPGVATLMTGNAICKAITLPHFPSTRDVFFIGLKGGLMLFPGFLILGAILLPFCKLLDARFRDYYILAGKLSPDSKRPDGHFPVFLLWIPLVFLYCFLAGICAKPRWSSLTTRQLAEIAAIGGSVWTPGSLIIGFWLWWVGERISNFERRMWDPAASSVSGDAIPFIKRQWEALVWLFYSQRHNDSPNGAA